MLQLFHSTNCFCLWPWSLSLILSTTFITKQPSDMNTTITSKSTWTCMKNQTSLLEWGGGGQTTYVNYYVNLPWFRAKYKSLTSDIFWSFKPDIRSKSMLLGHFLCCFPTSICKVGRTMWNAKSQTKVNKILIISPVIIIFTCIMKKCSDTIAKYCTAART